MANSHQHFSNYTHKAISFFPQIHNAGNCFGHAHLAKQAILASDLQHFTRRLGIIYYGVIDPKNPKKILNLTDLNKVISDLGLEKYIENVNYFKNKAPNNREWEEDETLRKQEFEKIKKELYPIHNSFFKKVGKWFDDHIPKMNVIKQFYNRYRNLLNDTLFNAHSEEIIKLLTQKEFYPLDYYPKGTPLLNKQELKEQVMLAIRIQQAFLNKIQHENDNQLNNAFSNNASSQSNVKSNIQQKLDHFHETYPFIRELAELECYFSNLALYQAPHKFKFLFPEKMDLGQHAENLVSPFTFPVSLDSGQDSGISKINKCCNHYTLANLQIYFATLNTHMEKWCKEINSKRPCAFVLSCDNHALTLTYQPEMKKWLIIESNQFLFYAEPNDVALSVFKIFMGIKRTLGIHTDIVTFFSETKKKWFLVEGRSSRNLDFKADDEQFALALLSSNKLENVVDADIHFNMSTSVYVCAQDIELVKPFINKWLRSHKMKKLHQISYQKLISESDITGSTFLDFVSRERCFDTLKRIVQCCRKSTTSKYFPLLAEMWINAIAQDNTEASRFFLENNADPNLLRKDGVSPLIIASQKGNLELVEKLIYAKANVNHECSTSQTSLFVAAINGRSLVINKLVEAKANPNYLHLNANNVSTLCYVIRNSDANLDGIKALIENKAEVNSTPNENCLLMAAANNHTATMELLINSKAEFNSIDAKKGWDNLAAAIHKDYSIPIPNSPELKGSQLLLIAFANNNNNMADILIRAGASCEIAFLVAALIQHVPLGENLLQYCPQDLALNNDIKESNIFKRCKPDRFKDALSAFHTMLREENQTREAKNDLVLADKNQTNNISSPPNSQSFFHTIFPCFRKKPLHVAETKPTPTPMEDNEKSLVNRKRKAEECAEGDNASKRVRQKLS